VAASANPGYVFVKWTEAGEMVSASANYSFSSKTNRLLVANFIAQPALKTLVTPSEITLSWPAAAAGWVLEESADLGSESWHDSSRPVNVAGSQKQVTVSPSGGSGYFRLVHR
jgi:hypothetical protein